MEIVNTLLTYLLEVAEDFVARHDEHTNGHHDDDSLNVSIIYDETVNVIRKFKNKSIGIDFIPNDVLECTFDAETVSLYI